MQLIRTTARASYWRLPSGVYQASKPGEKPTDNGAGYHNLQALMRLKGD